MISCGLDDTAGSEWVIFVGPLSAVHRWCRCRTHSCSCSSGTHHRWREKLSCSKSWAELLPLLISLTKWTFGRQHMQWLPSTSLDSLSDPRDVMDGGDPLLNPRITFLSLAFPWKHRSWRRNPFAWSNATWLYAQITFCEANCVISSVFRQLEKWIIYYCFSKLENWLNYY